MSKKGVVKNIKEEPVSDGDVVRSALQNSKSNQNKTIRLTPTLANVWLKLQEDYAKRNAPIPADAAADIVRANSGNQKNPYSTLHELGTLGVLQIAAGTGKNRARIPLTIGIEVFLVRSGLKEEQIWPVVEKDEDSILVVEPVSAPAVTSRVASKEELQAKLAAKYKAIENTLNAWNASGAQKEQAIIDLESKITCLEEELAEYKTQLSDAREALEDHQHQDPENINTLHKEAKDLTFVIDNYDTFTAHLLHE